MEKNQYGNLKERKPEEILRELNNKLEQKLITQDEYEREREEVIDSIILKEDKCNTNMITKRVVKTRKENIAKVFFVSTLILLMYMINAKVAQGIASIIISNDASYAIYKTNVVGLANIVVFILIGAIFYCLNPLFFEKRAGKDYALSLIGTVILCITCYFVQGITVGRELEASLYECGIQYARISGVSILLLQGAIVLLKDSYSIKRFVMSTFVLLIIYFVIWGGVGVASALVLRLGVNGLSVAQLLGAGIIYIGVLIKGKKLKKRNN